MSKSKPKKKKVEEQGQKTPISESEVPSYFAQFLQEPVAIGLAIMVFLRPWRDGITYPSVNYYFVGFTAFLCIFLAIRMLLRKQPIHSMLPIALLFSFIVIAFLTGTQSVQPDLSHQSLIQYLGYIGVLFLCTNGIRTRFGVGIVLASITCTGLLNAIYAVLHVEYTLPYIRQSIIDNPNLIRSFFGGEGLTAELKNRLEMDRAFGTLLFPNALAAYLILSIPYYFGQLWGASMGVKSTWKNTPDPNSLWDSGLGLLLLPALTAFAVGIYIYAMSSLFGMTVQGLGQIIESPLAKLFFYVLIPGSILVGGVALIMKKGLMSFGQVARVTTISLAGIVQCVALWLSLSRGGMLGLFIGVMWTLALILLTTSLFKARFSKMYSAVGIALILFFLFPMTPPLNAETPTDFGFEMPVLAHDYRPQILNLTPADIEVDGKKVTVKDLADAGSLEYRITYWQVGLRMIQDNFFTGVGLNNFGTIYGKYQFLDAGDVKTAHNDYVQVFAETGILGFLTFSAFWIYIGLSGAGRILREQTRTVQFTLAGLYAGIMAFLAHSFLDFNFINPALTLMLFIVTGLFLAYGRLSDPETTDFEYSSSNSKFQKITVGVVVALSIYSIGMSWRQIGIDYKLSGGSLYQRITYLGNDRHIKHKMEVATFLYRDLRAPKKGEDYPHYSVPDIQKFIPDLETIKTFGTIRVDTDGIRGGATRPFIVGEEITDFTYIFFGKSDTARTAAMKQIRVEIKLIEELDASWTNNTKTAQYLFSWNKLLLEGVRINVEPGATAEQHTQAKQRALVEQRRYAEELLKWAQAMVERSPERPWNYFNLGQAMWLKGNTSPNPQGQIRYYKDGLAVYEKGYQLYPVNTEICQAYGEALNKMSEAFKSAGNRAKGSVGASLRAEGEEYAVKAAEVSDRGKMLARYKFEVLGLR